MKEEFLKSLCKEFDFVYTPRMYELEGGRHVILLVEEIKKKLETLVNEKGVHYFREHPISIYIKSISDGIRRLMEGNDINDIQKTKEFIRDEIFKYVISGELSYIFLPFI